MNPYIKQKQTHRHRKQAYGYQREKGGGQVINQEYGINIQTTIHKIDKQQDLLYNTGNNILVITYNRK